MNLKTFAIGLLAGLAGALITFAVLHGRAEKAGDEEAPERPARVAVAGAETIVSIDPDTAAKSGITATVLEPAKRSSESRAFATAADVRELVDARSQIAVARAQEAQARAHLAAAEAEARRLRTLHDDNRNISDRVLQEAEANVAAERANGDAAAATANAAESAIRIRWGAAVAQALESNQRWIDDLVENRSVLLQVVSPTQPPRTVEVDTQDGAVKATFIAPSPRSDPRVQGKSWLYLAPAGAIVPGMTLSANVGGASAKSGVVVPRDAVVWAGGKSWVYVERGAGRYARVAVDTSASMADGFFVTTLEPGTRVVTTGAQDLLSEESKPKVEE